MLLLPLLELVSARYAVAAFPNPTPVPLADPIRDSFATGLARVASFNGPILARVLLSHRVVVIHEIRQMRVAWAADYPETMRVQNKSLREMSQPVVEDRRERKPQVSGVQNRPCTWSSVPFGPNSSLWLR